MTRFATIVFAGRPNAGKSTLLNAILGTNLSIVSARPQTTRHPVVGVDTDGEVQLELVDPAGLVKPAYPLQEAMVRLAADAIAHAHGVVYLHPPDGGDVPSLDTLLADPPAALPPVLTVLTKSDLVGERDRDRWAGVDLRVSATTKDGIPELLAWCRERARPGPWRHDPDAISGLPVRFFAAEYIREAAFLHLDQELPYSVAVEIDEFREENDPVYIRAALFVERQSQKGMVIGQQGRTIREIGAAARRSTEALLGQRVYLDLRVKVLPKWRKSLHHLGRMGFPAPEQEKR
ncbi:MAG TPA: GTPase Era [Gemmatimonadales bacterium]|jgi:GTP-binding protein Era